MGDEKCWQAVTLIMHLLYELYICKYWTHYAQNCLNKYRIKESSTNIPMVTHFKEHEHNVILQVQFLCWRKTNHTLHSTEQ